LEFIGKEANRWEEQFFLGVEPEAQIVYGTTIDPDALRARIREYAQAHGVAAVAAVSGVSVRTAGSVVRGTGRARPSTLARLLQGGSVLDERTAAITVQAKDLLDRVRQASDVEGLRAFARRANVSASHLSEALRGSRALSRTMTDRVRVALAAWHSDRR
jgi:transcriptional regulator with XRE-family HTH domain